LSEGETRTRTGGRLGESVSAPLRLSAVLSDRHRNLVHALKRGFLLLVAVVLVALPFEPAHALSAADLPLDPPPAHVLDQADVLSRASRSELSKSLASFDEFGVEASWISVPRLDYGLSLGQLGQEILRRWESSTQSAPPQLLFLIDSQTSGTAIVASDSLSNRLEPSLLSSTSRTTMTQPLREGGRYRQASLDAVTRIRAVLSGEPDPGEPVIATTTAVASSIPSREETQSSRAFTWVAVLLVVGTIVPMLTWWVFSR